MRPPPEPLPRSLVRAASGPARGETRQGLALARLLVTAHHPVCDRFQNDVFLLRHVPLCRGCVLVWPLFFAVFASAWFVLHYAPGAWPLLLGSGFLLGIPQGFTYLRRWSVRTRVFAKVSGGIGLALLLSGLLAAPYPIGWRLAALGGLGVAFLALQALRMRRILAVCDACPWQRDWAQCPGMMGARGHPYNWHRLAPGEAP